MLSGWAAAATVGTDYDVLLRQKDFLEARAMLENDHAITTPERQYVEGVLANRSGAGSALLGTARPPAHRGAERSRARGDRSADAG